MEDITYYLFGSQVVRMATDGCETKDIAESISFGDGAIYAHNESDHSSKLIDAMDGWNAAETITKSQFDEINRLLS